MFRNSKYSYFIVFGLIFLCGIAPALGQSLTNSLLSYLPDNFNPFNDSLDVSFDPLNFNPDSIFIGTDGFFYNSGFMADHALLAGFTLPLQGKVISKFGVRSGRMHTGTDIKLNAGDTVNASFYGIVEKAKSYYGYGQLVVLNHSNNIDTYYGHLSKMLVSVGDTVRKGQPIGLGGRTGRATTNHLHFEIRERRKPYNPELVFNFTEGTLRPEATSQSSLASLYGIFNKIEKLDNPYEYVVKAGDSLWAIARRFSTNIQTLCELNNLQTSTVLKIGSVIKLNPAVN